MIECRIDLRGTAAVVVVQGEVDLESSPTMRDRLFAAFGSDPKTVVVDLSAVPYMDSSGVAVLVEGIQESRRRKIAYRLAGPSAAVRGILDLARLTSYFEIRDSVDAAL